jgi:hypothetical protein
MAAPRFKRYANNLNPQLLHAGWVESGEYGENPGEPYCKEE